MTTRADLTIEAGTDWAIECDIGQEGDSADLTGYTGTVRFGRYPGATARLTLTPDAGLTIYPEGVILISLTEAQTAALESGWYQVELTSPDGHRDRPYEGAVTVTPALRG